MKVERLHVMLGVTALLLAACESRPTEMQKAAAESAAKKDAASASGEDGPFRKVVRDGATYYCDPSPRTGTRMSKPYCLNESQYADWKEKNTAMKEDMQRGSVGITTSNRDPGPR
jgi:hypothetical protein